MYEIERYTSVNAIGCAVLLEEVVEAPRAIGKLLVASSMSIYGEGQYRNPSTGESGLAPRLRPEAQLARREWDVLADDGTPLEPEPTAETKPLRPTLDLRRREARPRGDDARRRRRVRHSRRRAPLLQRLRRAAGARRIPYTGVAAIFASRLLNGQRAARVRGRAPDARLHRRARHRARLLAGSSPGRRRRAALNVGTGTPTSIVEARILTIPSNFTLHTGMAHWEVLLRAPAIENQAFVRSPPSTGTPGGLDKPSYGHSMIIDPWGTVLAQSPEGDGVIVADLDLDAQTAIRERLPALLHIRPDIYQTAHPAHT